MALFNSDSECLKNTIEVLREQIHAMVVEECKSFTSKEVIRLSQLLDQYLIKYAKESNGR